MRTEVNQSPHLLVWIAGVAITSFCAAAMAALIGWLPTLIGGSKKSAAPIELSVTPVHPAGSERDRTLADVVSDTPTRATCAECGVVESMREMDARGNAGALGTVVGNAIEPEVESTRSYEFIIRFEDGSRRVFNEATPRTWRSGARVKVID